MYSYRLTQNLDISSFRALLQPSDRMREWETRNRRVSSSFQAFGNFYANVNIIFGEVGSLFNKTWLLHQFPLVKSPWCDFNKGNRLILQKVSFATFFCAFGLDSPFVSLSHVVGEMKFMCLCLLRMCTKDLFAEYSLSLCLDICLAQCPLTPPYICLFKAKKSTGIQTYIKYSNCIQIEGDLALYHCW